MGGEREDHVELMGTMEENRVDVCEASGMLWIRGVRERVV